MYDSGWHTVLQADSGRNLKMVDNSVSNVLCAPFLRSRLSDAKVLEHDSKGTSHH